MNPEDYRNLYKKISEIVNEIDPGYYNGPPDEYDFQVRGIIQLIERREISNLRALVKLFFGQRENISSVEKENMKRIMEQVRLL